MMWSHTIGVGLVKVTFPTVTSQATAVMLGRENIFYILVEHNHGSP